ncbi:MAG: DUF2232 domain-containing protein [Proteobacteria bacterium]|nr:DUF2232 domain-containing protein [Pseudomonadota bacterium]
MACGALYLFTDHAPFLIGLNGFQLFMTLYTLQGFSILSFFFHRLEMHDFLKFLAYALLFFIALPLVVALGFFDLWFDFRRKFGQT